jgi:phage-related protein
MSQPRILKLGILADTSELVKGLKKAEGSVNDSGSRISDGFKKVGIAVAAAGAAVGAFAIALGKQSIQAAIQAESEQNRLAQILRTTGATEREIEVLDRQSKALEQIGVISGGNIKVLQSQLATFDLQAGTIQRLTPAILDYVTAEKGATASADDFKSMTNGLAQALNGNFASLTKTGFVLDENTKNLIKNGTETERAQALVDVLNSTYKGFNETLAETSEGRLIQLRNNLDTIKERIGNALLPVLRDLTQFFVEKILPVIDKLVSSFEKNANPAISKMKDVIVGFVLPALKNLYEFFVQFIIPTLRNLLEPALSLVERAFQFLSNKVKENREGLDVFIAIASKLAQFVRDTVAPILGGILATAFNLVVRAVGQAIDNFAKVFEIIGKVARFFGFNFSVEVGKATKTVNNLNTGTVDAYKSFAEQSRTINQEVIPSLTGATVATNGLTAATKGAASATKSLTALQRELNALRAGGALPSAISPDQAAFFKSELGLISEFGGKIEGINLLPTDPFFGFGQGSSVNKALQQRAGGSATATGTVNINVTGTVIDPEGAARAIEQLISDSNARGGALVSDLFGINP